MNVFRLTAVAFSLILFSACGGGGGGGGSAGGGGVTPPPPPPALESLPDWLITNTGQAAVATGGDSFNMTPDTIERILESRAGTGAANRQLRSDVHISDPDGQPNIPVNCSGRNCTAEIPWYPEPVRFEYSLDAFGDIPRINDQELIGYNGEYNAVMTKAGVMLAQFRAAGRDNNGVINQYQSYGGWLEESVFAVQIDQFEESETADGETVTSLFSYSFGNASGDDPESGTATTATWNGVMVGAMGASEVVQGDVAITADFSGSTDTVAVNFMDIKSLNTGMNIPTPSMTWGPINLTGNGTFTFSDNDDSIEGTFYGEGHNEVGGIFDRDSIVGAFGATR